MDDPKAKLNETSRKTFQVLIFKSGNNFKLTIKIFESGYMLKNSLPLPSIILKLLECLLFYWSSSKSATVHFSLFIGGIVV